ncbi:hypothetical protein [Priestia megaterium]|uniref:hypothetical protein n=1 Tax=Priestia megaterium TaxID=1404 RepID=UPI00203FE714|nr:hypothetical protein [Priestia megaterium]MCM3308578.1 hypothetical protein [Priestia megaterium]
MKTKNNKIKEVILHVGLHKTGTTSIQKTLFSERNNKILEQKGYIYPKIFGENHSYPLYSAFCDSPETYYENIKKGYTNSQIQNINSQNLDKLRWELLEKEQSKLIISGEDISRLSVKNLKELKRYINSLSTLPLIIKVLIYVRNPINWSVSAIQEKIKGGETYQTAFYYMENHLKFHFQKKFKKFLEVFGKEHIEIYPFEDAISYDYGPVGHFLSILDFHENEIDGFNIIRGNESMSLVTGEILSFINERLPMLKNGKINVGRSEGDFALLLNIRGPKFDIPQNDKIKLLESSQEDAKWFKDKFNIDYLNSRKYPIDSIDLTDCKFIEETLEDIEKIFLSSELSPPLRELIVKFLKEQIDKNSHFLNKPLLEEIIKKFSP